MTFHHLKLFTLSVFTLAAASAHAAPVKLSIESVGDEMKFNKTDLEVKAGSTVELTLKNVAKSDAMKHNWVLVKAGTAEDVGNAGAAAGEKKDYIPDSPSVLAHTKLAAPGKTVKVTFKAPPAGDYPFICSYPGHYVFMKGTLHVK
jgi:azurin